jgi:hypothetical protein
MVTVVKSVAAAVALMALATRAQHTTARIQVDDSRPLAAVISELEKRHGRVITYEDPFRIHSSDIAEGRPVPRGGHFTFTYYPPVGNSDAVLLAVLNNLVEQFNRDSPDAQFRVTQTGVIFQVLPSRSKDAAGVLQPAVSPLDTIVSVPEDDAMGLHQLVEIVGALRAAGYPRFGLGVVPLNSPRVPVDVAKRPASARDAIVRVLNVRRAGPADVPQSTYRWSYQVFCDVGSNPACMLNVHSVPLRPR